MHANEWAWQLAKIQPPIRYLLSFVLASSWYDPGLWAWAVGWKAGGVKQGQAASLAGRLLVLLPDKIVFMSEIFFCT